MVFGEIGIEFPEGIRVGGKFHLRMNFCVTGPNVFKPNRLIVFADT